MTKFDKEMFTWDGMYLMYKGDFDGAHDDGCVSRWHSFLGR